MFVSRIAAGYQAYRGPDFNLDEMMGKAVVFTKAHRGGDELLEYIEEILHKPEFQSNPKGYLDDWKRERGNSEIFKRIEDTARIFFDENFKF